MNSKEGILKHIVTNGYAPSARHLYRGNVVHASRAGILKFDSRDSNIVCRYSKYLVFVFAVKDREAVTQDYDRFIYGDITFLVCSRSYGDGISRLCLFYTLLDMPYGLTFTDTDRDAGGLMARNSHGKHQSTSPQSFPRTGHSVSFEFSHQFSPGKVYTVP